MAILSAALSLLLVIVHLFSGKLNFLNVTPRSIWLSSAGGVSVAYVFLHLLPELSAGQVAVQREGISDLLPYAEHHVYILGLLGLMIFYGLERAARESRLRSQHAEGAPSNGVFWLHIVSFSVYNLLIGYLLVDRIKQTALSLIFYAVAMALHFVVNDHGLHEHFEYRYDHLGRWILVSAIVMGWVLGWVLHLTDAGIALIFAFLAGGVVLNIMKEELPEERQSRFWAFAVGASIYALLLLTI